MYKLLSLLIIGIFLISFVSAGINLRVNGEYVKTSGINTYIENNLSVWDLIIRSGQSLTLGGAHFTNEDYYTSVDTSLGVHSMDSSTNFMSVQNHNGTPGAVASLILESGTCESSSTFNIIKLESSYAPGHVSFVNEDGKIGSYVNDGQSFEWLYFDNVTKDDKGNLNPQSFEGTKILMVLNGTDLEMKGNATANYFIGDGSLLTNLPGGISNMLSSNDGYKQAILTNNIFQYFDGTRNRFDFSAVHTKLYSPDGDYTLLDNQQYVYNDGTRNRLEINGAGSMLVSPNGAETIIVGNEGVLYNMVEVATVNDINSNWDTAYGWGNHINLYSLLLHRHEGISSPDGLKNLTLDDTNFIYNDGTWNRFGITEITTILVSPDGTENLQIANNGVLYNDIKVATIDNLHNENIIISNNDSLIINDTSLIHNDGLVDRSIINTVESVFYGPFSINFLRLTAGGVYYNDVEIATVDDLASGTVIASVTWNANTISSGEATAGYRKNHLRAFRLAPGIWSVENMGTNSLMPGDSADWVINSLRGGTSDPFFIAELTINAFGQPSVGHPVTMEISATSTGTSPNTGNLGSIILKIKNKDGVVSDPTLADAYATVKLTYIE